MSIRAPQLRSRGTWENGAGRSSHRNILKHLFLPVVTFKRSEKITIGSPEYHGIIIYGEKGNAGTSN
jgi:hypothetical protein